jgi:xylulokinase
MSKVLTFDLGTSYFKVCLFDDSLRLLASVRTAVPVEHPAIGRSELSVAAFEQCLDAAVRELARKSGGLNDVKRVSFASQANSFTLLDSTGRLRAPFLLWTDQRARDLEPRWRGFTASPAFYAKTGLAQFDHHFMLPKIEWLRSYRPDILERATQLCGLSDYLVHWLTNLRATEAGIASLTGLVDIQQCRYWDEAVDYFQLAESWLPPIVRAGADLGPIRSHFVKAWGLSTDCGVVMGCLDQYAGALGAGVISPGQVCETTGTVLATVTCARSLSTDAAAGVFQGPSHSPDLYYRMMFSRVGAGLLEKYRNQQADRPAFADLDKLADEVPPNSAGLRLHADAPDLPVDKMFEGKNSSHHRGHEVRAIMEGVARELRNQLTALCGNERPQKVRSVGGAARSGTWLRIKSDIVGCPVEAINCAETTSLGAAKLALHHLGDDDAGC